MKTHATFRLASLLAGLGLAAGIASAADRMAEAGFSVTGARPLSAAADLLENRFGMTVTYEDPPYLYEKDLKPYSTATDLRNPPLIPAGTGFSLGYEQVLARSGTPTGPVLLTGDLVAAHAAAAQPGRFQVTGTGTRLHLVPTQVRNAEGVLEGLRPVLDTPVLLAPGQRSALDVATELCAALTAAGSYPVDLGVVPFADLDQRNVFVDPAATPARELLDRMSAAGADELSWRLFFEPARNRFLLHLHIPRAPAEGLRVVTGPIKIKDAIRQ
jgi:hypothetical protein